MSRKALRYAKLERLICESSESEEDHIEVDSAGIDSDSDGSIVDPDFVPDEENVKEDVEKSLICIWKIQKDVAVDTKTMIQPDHPQREESCSSNFLEGVAIDLEHIIVPDGDTLKGKNGYLWETTPQAIGKTPVINVVHAKEFNLKISSQQTKRAISKESMWCKLGIENKDKVIPILQK
ncbi:unnamed protein product [Diabrotica balteata]|uniref:Uncharacterized protein n=1 Tax=Diabrotica balteata TaxID=107213 RepID=A0A9N9SST7_DIABA|nr:unnamed protein product [Diabrotica balteata]